MFDLGPAWAVEVKVLKLWRKFTCSCAEARQPFNCYQSCHSDSCGMAPVSAPTLCSWREYPPHSIFSRYTLQQEVTLSDTVPHQLRLFSWGTGTRQRSAIQEKPPHSGQTISKARPLLLVISVTRFRIDEWQKFHRLMVKSSGKTSLVRTSSSRLLFSGFWSFILVPVTCPFLLGLVVYCGSRGVRIRFAHVIV